VISRRLPIPAFAPGGPRKLGPPAFWASDFSGPKGAAGPGRPGFSMRGPLGSVTESTLRRRALLKPKIAAHRSSLFCAEDWLCLRGNVLSRIRSQGCGSFSSGERTRLTRTTDYVFVREPKAFERLSIRRFFDIGEPARFTYVERLVGAFATADTVPPNEHQFGLGDRCPLVFMHGRDLSVNAGEIMQRLAGAIVQH
jgi:hypothetical protein